MPDFPQLLRPGAIGSLTLRNRILMAPMGDSLAEPDGSISDAQLAYFEARARGGAALLLVGSVAVAYPDGCVDARQVAASDDRYLPGLTALADRVHRHGAAV
ncbi:MAG: effector protein, partial [Acidimicrobiia bacterium]